MPATRRKNMASVERSSSESSLYTASGTSYNATDSDASSSSPAPGAGGPLRQRRTRKRISPTQLTALENLFQRASHPSQHEREVLAKAINMEVKNVTIWFQNRRQAARKFALHEAITHSNALCSPVAVSGLLAEVCLRGRASPVTPEEIATPPANEEQFSVFPSSCPSPAIMVDPTWQREGSPYIFQNDSLKPPAMKRELDEDMFAAALALAQMKAV